MRHEEAHRIAHAVAYNAMCEDNVYDGDYLNCLLIALETTDPRSKFVAAIHFDFAAPGMFELLVTWSEEQLLLGRRIGIGRTKPPSLDLRGRFFLESHGHDRRRQ